jgi:hypothetical protein
MEQGLPPFLYLPPTRQVKISTLLLAYAILVLSGTTRFLGAIGITPFLQQGEN